MNRRAILHIGPMKTGSSSIQRWLSRESAALATSGIVCPKAFGPNMSRLAGIAEGIDFGLALTPLDVNLLDDFTNELKALKETDHTVVISAEMLGHLLSKADQIEILRGMLAPYVSSFSVIAYLRRQDELSLSRYSTALRRGERNARPLSTPINFGNMLDLWAEVFGKENVLPRIYDRASMQNGDVVEDFCAAAQIPFIAGSAPIRNNQSLSAESQAFLSALQLKIRGLGYKRAFDTLNGYSEIVRFLSKRFSGEGMRPARRDAEAFYERCRDWNEQVRAKWFPERKSLFSEDFSSYPEEPSTPLTAEEQLDLAMSTLARVLVPRPKAEPNPREAARESQRDQDEKLLKERRVRRLELRGEGNKRDASQR